MKLVVLIVMICCLIGAAGIFLFKLLLSNTDKEKRIKLPGGKTLIARSKTLWYALAVFLSFVAMVMAHLIDLLGGF